MWVNLFDKFNKFGFHTRKQTSLHCWCPDIIKSSFAKSYRMCSNQTLIIIWVSWVLLLTILSHRIMSLDVKERLRRPNTSTEWEEKNFQYCNILFFLSLTINKPATQAAGADPSRSNFNNRPNQPYQCNGRNFWTNDGTLMPFEI